MVPEATRKYLIALALSARKSNILGYKINRIVRFLSALRKSQLVDEGTKNSVDRNVANLRGSLQMMKQLMKNMAAPMVGSMIDLLLLHSENLVLSLNFNVCRKLFFSFFICLIQGCKFSGDSLNS
jgi:hypothetical protein